MHCKSCLKRAQYFSTCMHPYCETCYKNSQTFCDKCEVGMTKSKIWELFERMSLRETYPTYSSLKSWICGYF